MSGEVEHGTRQEAAEPNRFARQDICSSWRVSARRAVWLLSIIAFVTLVLPIKGLWTEAAQATLLSPPEQQSHPPLPSSFSGRVVGEHRDRVLSVVWSPDGKRLASASADNTTKVWDVASGRELRPLTGHRDFVWSVAWNPDGTRLVTGSEDHTAKVWDAASGRELLTLTGHSDSVQGVGWSPDGKRVATASRDNTAKIWDAESGKLLMTLTGHTDYVWSVAWNIDGSRLATASWDGTAKVWDTATGKSLLTLSGVNARLFSVGWSQDGRRLATASEEHLARVWDADSGKELLTLTAHKGFVLSAAWSPDGTRIATGSVDGEVKLWDAVGGDMLQTVGGLGASVFSVAWSPDGTRLATGSGDHKLRVWNVRADTAAQTRQERNRPAQAETSTAPPAAGQMPLASSLEHSAPYVTTPQAVVVKLLELAKVQPDDIVYDLGSGDGRIVITAAKEFRAHAVGVELDGVLFRQSEARIKALGLANRAQILHANMFKVSVREATVVTLYLLPFVNTMLRPMLEKQLRPGARVVSHDFVISGWEPTRTIEVVAENGELHKLYLYVRP